MSKVLLTNGQLRKTLAAIRSLGSKGIYTVVSEETAFNPAAFSRYCGRSEVYPAPSGNSEVFYRWMLDAIERNKIDSLFPMDDDVMEIVMEHRDELKGLCKLVLPPLDSYRAASDKGTAALLAEAAGIGCPRTVIPRDLAKIHDLTSHMAYPLIIKPRKSSGSRGIRIVEKKEDLSGLYMDIHATYPFPLIQECIGLGDRYDVCLVYNTDGQLRASFVQKEIRHFPVEIGPSTVQESVWRPDLVEMALCLMAKLPWCGVVELEFMVDSRDGRPKFMEINPRFWNSLHLAILAGVDFPWLLHSIGANGDVDGVFDYKTGIKCKWTLPGDILHFIANRERFKMDPPFLGGKRYNTYDDMISLKDPLPALGFVLACGRYIFDMSKWKFMLKR